MQRIFYTFAFFLLIVFWIQTKIGRGNRGQYELWEQFAENERQANSVRKKDIDVMYFITADLSLLPFDEEAEGELGALQAAAAEGAVRKMLRFDTPMSNTEVKMAFGTANLEIVTAYEENYERFITTLIRWAEELYKAGRAGEAKQILIQCAALKSDYVRSYVLLAKIYEEEEDFIKIEELVQSVKLAPYLTQKDRILREIAAGASVSK